MLLVVINGARAFGICPLSFLSHTPIFPSSSTPLYLISCSDGVLVLGRERNVNMVFSVGKC